jgi:tetratricopeptide (TPR) repeat protein
MTDRPKVFISYSHDSPAHSERIWRLAERLRDGGVECTIDQYEPFPAEGWPLWMDRQVEEADFVLVVCTPTYYRKAKGKEPPGVGHGVKFESVLIYQDLYDAAMRNKKFIPVLFEELDRQQILGPLRPYTKFRADTQDGYEGLLRYLTGRLPERRPLPVQPPEDSPAVSSEPASEEIAAPEKRRHWRWLWMAAGFLFVCVAAIGFRVFHPGSRLPQFLPSDLEARQPYIEGLESMTRFDAPQAKRSFERVLKIQDFPPARSLLAEALVRLGYSEAALREAKRALDGSSRLPEEERLAIRAREQKIDHDFDAAIQTYQQLLDRYPKSSRYLEYGFGLADSQIGALKAKDALHDLKRLEPAAKQDPRFYLWRSWAASKIPDNVVQRDAAAKAIEAVEGKEEYRQLEAKARLFRGIALCETNELDAAVTDFEKAEKAYGEDDPRGRLQALDALALVWLGQGKLAQAKEARQSEIKVFEGLKDYYGLASQHLKLAEVLSDQGALAEAWREGVLADRLFHESEENTGQAQALADLSEILRKQGKLREAREMIERARSLQIQSEEGYQLQKLAEIQLQEMELKLAEDNFERSQQSISTEGDPLATAGSWMGLGDVAVAQGDLDKAEGGYQEALKLCGGFKRYEAAAQVGLAAVLLEKQRPEEAIGLLEKALALFRGEHIHDEEALAEALQIRALLARNQLAEARSALDRARELAGASERPEVRIEVALAEARVHDRMGEQDVAVRALQSALAQTQQMGLASRALEVRLVLGGIEARKGDRSRLEGVEKEARIHGFLLIADKARRLLDGRGPAPV